MATTSNRESLSSFSFVGCWWSCEEKHQIPKSPFQSLLATPLAAPSNNRSRQQFSDHVFLGKHPSYLLLQFLLICYILFWFCNFFIGEVGFCFSWLNSGGWNWIKFGKMFEALGLVMSSFEWILFRRFLSLCAWYGEHVVEDECPEWYIYDHRWSVFLGKLEFFFSKLHIESFAEMRERKSEWWPVGHFLRIVLFGGWGVASNEGNEVSA